MDSYVQGRLRKISLPCSHKVRKLCPLTFNSRAMDNTVLWDCFIPYDAAVQTPTHSPNLLSAHTSSFRSSTSSMFLSSSFRIVALSSAIRLWFLRKSCKNFFEWYKCIPDKLLPMRILCNSLYLDCYLLIITVWPCCGSQFSCPFHPTVQLQCFMFHRQMGGKQIAGWWFCVKDQSDCRIKMLPKLASMNFWIADSSFSFWSDFCGKNFKKNATLGILHSSIFKFLNFARSLAHGAICLQVLWLFHHVFPLSALPIHIDKNTLIWLYKWLYEESLCVLFYRHTEAEEKFSST